MRSVIVLSLVVVASGWFTRDQSTAVMGWLNCKGKPLVGATLKLYDEDVFADYLMAETTSAYEGRIAIRGQASEMSTIEPQLHIYHRCDYEGPCNKKLVINVPKGYITFDTYPQYTYDVDIIELSTAEGQTVKC